MIGGLLEMVMQINSHRKPRRNKSYRLENLLKKKNDFFIKVFNFKFIICFS